MSDSMIFKGDALVIPGDNVNADMAMCWSLGTDSLPVEEKAKLFMKGIDPTIADKAKKDNILVCGKNFGYGKTHMLLFDAMKAIDIRCIVAESFATQLMSTCLNIPGGNVMLVECPDIQSQVNDGDSLEVDPEQAIVRNLTQGTVIQGKPFPEYIYNIMKDGGYFASIYKKVMIERKMAEAKEMAAKQPDQQ